MKMHYENFTMYFSNKESLGSRSLLKKASHFRPELTLLSVRVYETSSESALTLLDK